MPCMLQKRGVARYNGGIPFSFSLSQKVLFSVGEDPGTEQGASHSCCVWIKSFKIQGVPNHLLLSSQVSVFSFFPSFSECNPDSFVNVRKYTPGPTPYSAELVAKSVSYLSNQFLSCQFYFSILSHSLMHNTVI